jgi:uncharacterized protein (DUF1015 family)
LLAASFIGRNKAPHRIVPPPCYNQQFPMANIIPFRAFRYDPKQVALAQAVTQPYDKITPAMQDRYYAASPYNLVRIILGRRYESDNTTNNIYSRAAANFRDWRQQGILRQDSLPSVYAYSQHFSMPSGGAELERRGFVALGRLEDYGAGIVFRHEQTLAKPKADRLDLLRSTCAHFGQIFMLYEDSGEIDQLVGTESEATISVTDEYGVGHRMWQISNAAVVDAVRSGMRDKKLIIADGHHRYETALAYRDECRAAPTVQASPGHPLPYEYAMMTFVNMNSPGLVILPTHRVVHSLHSFSADDFRDAARAFFDLEEIDASLDASRAVAILREAGRAGTAMLAVAANRAFLIHKPQPGAAQFLADSSLRQQSLDVVQLHKCLLEGVLKLSPESIREQKNIAYVRDATDALAGVRGSGARANIAFLMNPCRMAQVRDIAFAGEVMPQKSTDFYPKLLSGLTIYALD